MSESTNVRVAVLLGSLRADSLNRLVADHLVKNAPAGVEVNLVEGLGELPFYNEEIDGDAAPASVQALRESIAGADRILLVSPEYNGTSPAVLNNAIDWLSRPRGAGVISGKPLGVVGVAPSNFGAQWAHASLVRTAGIAGAQVIEDVTVSQSVMNVDLANDAEVLAKFENALAILVEGAKVAA